MHAAINWEKEKIDNNLKEGKKQRQTEDSYREMNAEAKREKGKKGSTKLEMGLYRIFQRGVRQRQSRGRQVKNLEIFLEKGIIKRNGK